MTLVRCDDLFEIIRTSNDAGRIAAAYRELFSFYPLLNYEIGRGSIYWRGKLSGPSGFRLERELGCPPALLCKAGRLNHPGASCLYAATRRTTVFTELHAEPGDCVHIVGIRFLNDKPVRLIAIGDLFHVYKTGYARSLGSEPGRALSKMLNEMDRSLATRILYVDAFLSQVLSDQHASEKDYLPTRILAEVAYQKTGAKGMFYPSVQDHIGMNMSISTEAYESCVHITMSQVVRITSKHDFGFFDVQPLKGATGISEEGEFTWGDAASDVHTNIFNLTKEEAEFASGHDGEDPNMMLDLMCLSKHLRREKTS
jgi:hypothetical protein